MKRIMNSRMRFVFFPLMAIAFLTLASFIVMLLWNHTLPDIFNVPALTFWQALCVFLLCKILFGFGGRRGGPPWMKHRRRGHGGFSDEEKEEFKHYMRDRICSWGPYSKEGQRNDGDKKVDDQ